MKKSTLCLDKEHLTSPVDGGVAPNIVVYTAALLWLAGPSGFEVMSVYSEDCTELCAEPKIDVGP